MKLISLLILLSVPHLMAQTPTIINVGAVHYPPYYDFSVQDKRPSGFLAEYLQKKLQTAGYQVIWHRIPLVRGEKSLKKNVIQVFGSYAPHPGDKAQVSYSKTPLIKMQPIICGLKDSLKRPTQVSEDDIHGSEVIYPRGAFVHPKMKALKMIIIRLDYSGDYIERSLKMIAKKRARFFILPESFRIRPYLKERDQLRCSNFVDPISMHLSFAQDSVWLKKIAPLIPEYKVDFKL